MTYTESEILLALRNDPAFTQRELADKLNLSLGLVNRSLQSLRADGLLSPDNQLTDKAIALLAARRPQNAVILAAGYGMRMVPVSNTPKALLEVRGERLIERQIRQIREAGIQSITVVIGYRKEQFEYLSDHYGVDLIFNSDYASSNNLHSLSLASRHLTNAYLIPCDLYCKENPFRPCEISSWYALSAEEDPHSDVRLNRKGEVVRIKPGETGNRMVGIAYLCGPEADQLTQHLKDMNATPHYRNAFWEEALYNNDRMIIPARVFPKGEAQEINTYEQLRELDSASGSLQAGAIAAICKVFGAREDEITNISVLKKGMTNRSFLFSVQGEQYIMRIPGEGTDKLINRRQEVAVYAAIHGKGLCDDPVFIDPDTGYKITKYLPGVRTCNPQSEQDVRICMTKLRAFHNLRLKVPHRFDLWGQIEFYELLWPTPQSMYLDYPETKALVLSLKSFVDAQPKEECLTHIDAVCDNFLFTDQSPDCANQPKNLSLRTSDQSEGELLEEQEKQAWASGMAIRSLPQLTDWEYAGMQDPHVDLAMFAVYSNFDRAKTDHLIDLYFDGSCPLKTRIKIYCYVAACGLLWSNWCEYKSSLGVEFGEYSLWQYRHAKDFARLAKKELSLRGAIQEDGDVAIRPSQGGKTNE